MDPIHDIIEALRQKKYDEFDTFYNLTKNQVFYAIINIVHNKDQAEDLMQETYIKFLEKIDQYKTGANPYAYLSKIARNLAINYYNREKKITKDDEFLNTIPYIEEQQPDDEDIFKILNLLDDTEKEVVTLKIINDLKFREIAAILKKPLGTVIWIYNKAIKKLKNKVGDVL
ncbi:RNA polymerase sigma factor [Acholeplasma granularum]|uniref:RNA polymerase sigma factor n=1 Tax=Acholeplasma granularum TaxID=264635 RepID=UPI0004AEB592|nr:RNA polymerase sigma factor [Acholeplasma granularum]